MVLSKEVLSKEVLSKATKTCVLKSVIVSCLALAVSSNVVAQSSNAEANYSALLQQIADLKTSIAYKEAVIATQKSQMDDLKQQIKSVDTVKASIDPMIDKMASAISTEIEKDMPFNTVERYERLGKLQDILREKDALPGDKMRRALNIYQAEVDYGQTFAYYEGAHPIEEKRGRRYDACVTSTANAACSWTRDLQKKLDKGATVPDLKSELQDGNYLRYGRLAFIYAEADGSEVYQYDLESRAWQEVKGGRALDFVRAVKMARGEAAVDVVTAPVLMPN